MSVIFTFEVIRTVDGDLNMRSESEQEISSEELLNIAIGMIDQGNAALKTIFDIDQPGSDVEIDWTDET